MEAPQSAKGPGDPRAKGRGAPHAEGEAPPLPAPGGGSRADTRERARMTVRNRRAASWTLPADRWAAGKAASRIVEAVRAWGYRHPDEDTIGRCTALLVGAAVADHGRRISVHAADQDGMLLIVVLSHRRGPAPEDDALLPRIAAVTGTAGCGTDAAEDGRRVWVLLETRPRPVFPDAAPARPVRD
ncbi:hypothetical protein ACFWUW_14140 [Streptomyces sp. NPDC058655]|uniref:hypothetical protein n=1 Tax=Streptomyces sp. NPDC058655 TaxID=3346577 RepID=UPI0036546618